MNNIKIEVTHLIVIFHEQLNLEKKQTFICIYAILKIFQPYWRPFDSGILLTDKIVSTKKVIGADCWQVKVKYTWKVMLIVKLQMDECLLSLITNQISFASYSVDAPLASYPYKHNYLLLTENLVISLDSF